MGCKAVLAAQRYLDSTTAWGTCSRVIHRQRRLMTAENSIA